MTSQAKERKTVFEDKHVSAWVFDSYLCLHWRNLVLDSHVRAITKVITPEIVGYISIISEDAKTPTSAQRQKIAEVLQASNIRKAAIVCDATGFRGAVIRSVMTTLYVVTGGTVVNKVFADVQSSARWMAPDHPGFTNFVLGCKRDAEARFSDR